MDILDSQAHIGPGGIDEMIAAMNALGIRSVLLDEYWLSVTTEEMPTYTVQAGVQTFRRAVSPTAELAAMTHPDRFSYLQRVDRRDPELGAIIRLARDASHCRALRIAPGLDKTELAELAGDGYDVLFAQAADCGMPVFVTIPGNAPVLRAAAARFPSVQFIVDHCGMPFSETLKDALKAAGLGETMPEMGGRGTPEEFNRVLQLADLGNVALKWGQAPGLFVVSPYPFEPLRRFLRAALDAFGSERVMWAGDASANMTGESWAELLFWSRDNPDLSPQEKADFLGGTARRILNW